MAVNTQGQDITQAGGSVVPTVPIVPISQTPITPNPQLTTPAISNAQPGYNANAAAQVPQVPQTPTTTVNVNATPTPQVAPQQTSAQNQLAMPATGSVVDLLNAAGQDSSFTARQQLAQQFGIQGYAGTAAQNTDLSKKYLDAYKANKGAATPETGAQASSALDSYFQDQAPEQKISPEATFFDAYAGMNPVVKSLYDTMTQTLSSTGTKQTFTEEFNKLRQEQGLEGLSTELMDIKNIMDGSEDDIRDEITKAGGFVTESQVQALKGARNKTLIKQAQNLSDQLAMRNDYVEQVMRLSGADREQVERDLDRKLGLTEKIADLQITMDDAARDNYQDIVAQVGYNGLAKGLQGNSSLQGNVEKLLGLNSGALSSNSAFLRAQNLKDKNLQYVSGTDNQRAGVFDPNTGTFTATGGGGSNGGGSSGGAGTPGVASGSVIRDAESVMSGVLNLQDISTKDNYRAQVSAELNKIAKEALASGDIYGTMRASAAYDDLPGDTFLQSMEKLVTTIDQIGVLQENISGTNTGPIAGAFRGANPWDTNAQTIKAQLNAIIPNLARGVYGEVGVLTDNDIKNYAKTLPNLTSTEDIRNAVLYITVDMIRRNAESKIKNQAAGQRDMSGYAETYKDIQDTADQILSRLPPSSKPGSANSGSDAVASFKTQLAPGEILVAREDRDGTRHYVAITPDELWATDIKQ